MSFLLLVAQLAHAGPDAPPLEAQVVAALDRAMVAWEGEGEVPHHVAVAVTDLTDLRLRAEAGAITADTVQHGRTLDIDLRLGDPSLDSTHPLRGMSGFDDDPRGRLEIAHAGPEEAAAVEHALWRELDARWREARERLVLLEGERRVRVEEEHPAPDFELQARPPRIDRQAVPPLDVDRARWRVTLQGLSERLDASDDLDGGGATLDVVRREVTWVDTEGSRLRHGRILARVGLSAWAAAEDGDRVQVFRAVDVADPADLPDEAALAALADEVVDLAERLARAPRAEPYTGPVLLSGRAAAVFVHEVMGHRVEGHRQKRESEGKTFLGYVGEPVLPGFVSIADDPTLARLEGIDLRGAYAYDDEGVPGERATLVEDGVFRGFLMSRSPLDGFPVSNGHGRRSAGRPPLARMGNTILTASETRSDAALRRELVRLLKRDGLEYGYVVEEIDGGFTMTGRVVPNAFNVRASVTRRVYADGRPDELVRGIDLVGTPLVAFRQIVAAGDTPEVFNGTCGAESGWVPVSAVSPALLFDRLEFQLKEKDSRRPPLLPKPSAPDDGMTDAGVSR